MLFAKAGLNQDFSPYHTICYLCQGSAEKYLKAFLISQGWNLQKVHDLSKLIEYCIDFNDKFLELFSAAEILNEYIIEGRYPGDLPFESIDLNDAKEAIKAAEKIASLVQKAMNT